MILLPLATTVNPFVGADTAGQTFAKPASKLSAELGGAFTSGNTMMYTLNGSLDGDHRWKQNKLTLDLGANLGRSVLDANADGHIDDDERAAGWTENARKIWVDGRYDRYVGKRDSLYTLAGTLIDPFAGYDNRSHAQLGYSHVLYQAVPTTLVAELGADVAREDYIDGVAPNEVWLVSIRAMIGVSHAFNANVSLADKVEVYESVPAFEDVRVLNQASLTAKLTDRFSLKLSHSLTFDNVPVEGFQPFDQSATVTFVASIL